MPSRVLSNGEPQSNGNTVPSRPSDGPDLSISDVRSTTQHFMPSMATHTPGPATQSSQIRSQQSALTKMAPGSQLADYQNSASTTTSGRKTSVRSNPKETQSSNGTGGEYPDFSMLPGSNSHGSQIPDTQGEGSGSDGRHHAGVSFDSGADVYGRLKSRQNLLKRALTAHLEVPSSQHSSQSQSQPTGSQPQQKSQFSIPPLPPRALAAHLAIATGTPTAAATTTQHTSNVNSLLNPGETPAYILDEKTLQAFHQQLTERSSGLSIEQLEQVYAALIGVIWDTRGKWNRNNVVLACTEKFNEVIQDIEGVQKVLQSSLEVEEERRERERRAMMAGAFDVPGGGIAGRFA